MPQITHLPRPSQPAVTQPSATQLTQKVELPKPVAPVNPSPPKLPPEPATPAERKISYKDAAAPSPVISPKPAIADQRAGDYLLKSPVSEPVRLPPAASTIFKPSPVLPPLPVVKLKLPPKPRLAPGEVSVGPNGEVIMGEVDPLAGAANNESAHHAMTDSLLDVNLEDETKETKDNPGANLHPGEIYVDAHGNVVQG